jgi:lysylphosphatidylglycerol synthetase-like protein (DUF2156 family)
MTNTLTKTLLTAAAIGLAATIPFAVMELVNRRDYDEAFPFMVFGFLWLTASVFSAALLLIARSLRNARHASPSRWAVLRLVALVLLLTLVAIVAADAWTTWVSDQWPCFMGVRNCD